MPNRVTRPPFEGPSALEKHTSSKPAGTASGLSVTERPTSRDSNLTDFREMTETYRPCASLRAPLDRFGKTSGDAGLFGIVRYPAPLTANNIQRFNPYNRRQPNEPRLISQLHADKLRSLA